MGNLMHIFEIWNPMCILYGNNKINEYILVMYLRYWHILYNQSNKIFMFYSMYSLHYICRDLLLFYFGFLKHFLMYYSLLYTLSLMMNKRRLYLYISICRFRGWRVLKDMFLGLKHNFYNRVLYLYYAKIMKDRNIRQQQNS